MKLILGHNTGEQSKVSISIQRLFLISITIFIAIISVTVTHSVIAAPAAPSNTNVEVCTWLDCKTGAISYSQDDAANIQPGSANSCQDELLAAGLRGTFYFEGTTSPSWLATLSNAGHEVGAHLANHHLNCVLRPSCAPNCTPETLLQIPYTITDVNNFRQTQLDPNIAAIESRTGKPVVSMAYSCGNTDASRMAASEPYFVGSRGYYVDTLDGNHFDWIYDVNAPTPVEFRNLNSDWYFHQELVDKAMSEGSWEIITVHDNCAGINVLKNISPTMWIAPVGEVLKYIRVRDVAQLANYARSGNTISFDAAHNLSTFQRQQLSGTSLLPIVYDNPVTLQARIPMTANIVSVQANGLNLPSTVSTISGTKYVRFNTPLTPTVHIVITGDAPLAVKVSSLSAASSSPDVTPTLILAGGVGLLGAVMRQRHQRRQNLRRE
jgi:hypothetical protein